MSEAVVSVVIPVHESEVTLRRCLDSVCGQTLRDVEVVCVDDASTDGSADILSEYAALDPRVKVLTFARNRGVSAARNAGISEATGRYVGFVDSDDFVAADFFEKLCAAAEASAADAAKGNILDCDAEGGSPTLTDYYDRNAEIAVNPYLFHYGFTSAVYRRKFLLENDIRFPEGVAYFEDPYFSVKAALRYSKVVCVDDAAYYYVRHDSSASVIPWRTAASEVIAAFEGVIGLIVREGSGSPGVGPAYAFVCRQLTGLCTASGIPEACRDVYFETASGIPEACRDVYFERVLQMADECPVASLRNEILSNIFVCASAAQKARMLRRRMRYDK